MKQKTLVIGLGVSGLAAAEFLLHLGKFVIGMDKNAAHLPRIQNLVQKGLIYLSENEPIDWPSIENVVVSPGISPSHPAYYAAVKHGVPIIGEAELALPHFKKPLVAVSGTNGKTTVTLLIEHILNTAGIQAKALGNVGTALCAYLLHPDDASVFVVELSSFQLETMNTPVFDAAVLLNITPDHLDRYASIREYAAAKCRLQFLLKEERRLLIQEEAASAYADLLKCDYQTFGVYRQDDQWKARTTVLPSENIENILPIQYRTRGKHENENALAAWALCQPFGVTHEQFCSALKTFLKPPHRIEFVREVSGVAYYDDSKGTNVDAVVQAVQEMKGPVILIAGGVDKGSSYCVWKEPFTGKVKQLIVIGQAAQKIHDELHPYFLVKKAGCLAQAVQLAAADAAKGDTVLLSPGCSSYDMFRDYAHRGEEFQRNVQLLERGDGS